VGDEADMDAAVNPGRRVGHSTEVRLTAALP
jgi:hypothetical protein